eukprot:TRINITY_DN33730_c0_g1_i1.p1 TRINITY_DN33730_c0_g1~~TRINITY_DN33730_c0_g1_i1.p1  ORF type:complete len:135 (-),score=34.95 TRINITY_DN33730_c0_g1_i1:138-542(-)
MFIIAVAELLGKDKKVMKYVFHTNVDMTIGPDNVDHENGDFFWADISAFTVFSDPDFCYDLMPKIFSHLTENSNLKESDIYITLNDIKPHHVGRNGVAIPPRSKPVTNPGPASSLSSLLTVLLMLVLAFFLISI